VRNYLLDASLQLGLAGHLISVAVALSAGLGWLLWDAWREASRLVALGDPEAAEAIAVALAAEDRRRLALVAAALCGVLLCLLGAAVVVTHRIAGPALAIGRTCRAVAEGRLPATRPLRARDLLAGLAADVGAMVEALRRREERERDLARASAAALRDPRAGPAERDAAAAAMERMAADKDARLRP
jgi:methyl-accepting chemotaxis protein